jgi:hypothetical protein
VTNIYRCLAASEEVELPEGFRVKFNSLWEIDSEKKANIATSLTNAVIAVHTAGLISDKVALQELRQSSHETGIFTNITEELIEQASEDPVPPADLAIDDEGEGADDGNPDAARKPEDD